MLVTAAVFQSTMLPYVVAAVVELVSHLVAASWMLPSVRLIVVGICVVGLCTRKYCPAGPLSHF